VLFVTGCIRRLTRFLGIGLGAPERVGRSTEIVSLVGGS